MHSDEEILKFWEERAALGDKAGSDDVLAKDIEVSAIMSNVKDGMKVAEFGCGNGLLAVKIAQKFDVKILAFDFSPNMISQAKSFGERAGVSDKVEFKVADIRDEVFIEEKFDLIITERMLINICDWSKQKEAICEMARMLASGGKLVICENSQTGLNELNELRRSVEIPEITPPWHNRYLVDEEVASVSPDFCGNPEVIPFSSTYYFLSRVVNAWLAKQAGVDPAYDAPINRLGTLLPPLASCAQGKIWIWTRA